MNTMWTSIKSWDDSFNDVTRLCLAATTGCFLVGGAFLLADVVVPLGARGVALIAVGCFFLVHGLFELAKHRWSGAAVPASIGPSPSESSKGPSSEPSQQAAA